MEGLQPTIDIGGNNGMGNWGGALIGGAIGGAVGSAWGRGGNWNNGNCCGGGCYSAHCHCGCEPQVDSHPDADVK